MKKIIIYLLTISILFSNLNFSKAQVDPSDFLKVPVIDPKAVGLLTDILGLLKDELKRLNLSVLNIIQTQLQEMSKEIATDALKAQQYIEILAEEEKMLEGRKEKVNTLEEYEKALREARIVGAYLGLQNFIKSIGSCLNPRIRDELTSYIMDISTEFSLEQKAKELLDKIPDCTEEESETVTLKPNFFAWLTQPFKLNLAQVSQNNQNEVSEIIITPAFQETEDSIELSNLQNLGLTFINEEAKKKEEERKKQIGEIWPIELCKKDIVDRNIDGGTFVCEEYEVLIEGKDLKRFREELALNKAVQNEITSASPQIALIQAGIKVPSIEEPSDFLNLDERKIKELAEKICAPYKAGETDLDKAYGMCLKIFAEQFERVAQIQKEKAEWKKREAQKAKEKFEEAQKRAEQLKGRLNNCPGAIQDLEKDIAWFIFKIGIFDELINTLTNIISEFNSLIIQIESLLTQIVDIIDEILRKISLLEHPAIRRLLDLLLSFLSGILGIDVKWLYDQIVNELKNLRSLMGRDVVRILNQFESLIVPLTKLMAEYQDLTYELYRTDLTSSSVLNDLYELDLILQKLDAYERAIAKGECSGEIPSGNIALIKNQVIVVESKNKENKSFNFLASLKNLFKPKLVEIKNEK